MSDITVIGLGLMGSALAKAIQRAEAAGYEEEHVMAMLKVLRED